MILLFLLSGNNVNIKVSPKRSKNMHLFSNISSTNFEISSTEIFDYHSQKKKKKKEISLNELLYWIAQTISLKNKRVWCA